MKVGRPNRAVQGSGRLLEEGLEPSRGLHPFGFSYHYGFRHPCGLWSGLSLDRGNVAVGLSRQVSTPSPIADRSLARNCHHPHVLSVPPVLLNPPRPFPPLPPPPSH